jgi:hypothetical protein
MLLVEDEQVLPFALIVRLHSEGCIVDIADDSDQGFAKATTTFRSHHSRCNVARPRGRIHFPAADRIFRQAKNSFRTVEDSRLLFSVYLGSKGGETFDVVSFNRNGSGCQMKATISFICIPLAGKSA